MNPDRPTLLADLTAAPDQIDELITAARKHSQHRVIRRKAALIAGPGLICALVIQQQSRPFPDKVPDPMQVTLPHRAKSLTADELLDSFGDQSVGLVTWPDGRQQLIAITPAPPGTGKRR